MQYKQNNIISYDKKDNYRYLKGKLKYKPIFYRFNYNKYKNSSFSSNENSKNTLNISTNNYNNYSQMQIEKYFNQKYNNINKLKKFGKYPSLPNFRVHKNNSLDFLYENDRYKIICNEKEKYENKNKRKYIKIPHFNYSCSLDKNNIFCLKYKKPKISDKKKTIKKINSLNNINWINEYKVPRMVKILKVNDKIYNEVFTQQWKYREFFEK